MSDAFALITFPPERDEFYADLRKEVSAYFKNAGHTHFGNRQMHVKVAVMFAVYFGLYACMLSASPSVEMLLVWYATIGVWGVFLGLNVGHDAAHFALFKSRKWNKVFLHVFDLLGTNSFNWKNRHVGAHHLFPNIMDHDSDIQQSDVVKIFPKDKHRSIHKVQWLYMPVVYMIYIFRWVVYRDFKDIFSPRLGGFDNRQYPAREIVKMLLFKLGYLGYIMVVPKLVLGFSWGQVFGAFVLLTVFASLTITMVLLSTHVGEHANFPEPDADGVMPHSWSHHHMLTAGDFATESALVTHLFGGFNHHVIHHLFQHICHIHYPALTKILIRVAAKHGVEYRSEKHMFLAMYSHFKLLYNNGNPINPELAQP